MEGIGQLRNLSDRLRVGAAGFAVADVGGEEF
jgi:hypothetical protein